MRDAPYGNSKKTINLHNNNLNPSVKSLHLVVSGKFIYGISIYPYGCGDL